MSRAELLRARVREAIDVCEALLDDEPLAKTLDAVVGAIVASLQDGGKVLLCGNGGSAADAQHLAAELVGRFCLERQPYAAIALSDNIAAVTAVGNDYGYEDVFTRAVRGLGNRGDVLIGLSTSGQSRNVIGAVEAARERGLVTVALVGGSGSPMEAASEHVLRVPGANTARIQEAQMLVGHTIFELVERELCDA
jgi:D-sedoheptulose 7-phosphate isomerase